MSKEQRVSHAGVRQDAGGAGPNGTGKLDIPGIPGVPGVPDAVNQRLGRFVEHLTRAAGDNLVSLALYGGLARGRYRPGRSDVNVLLVLRDTSPAALGLIVPVLRDGFRTLAVEPMILTEAELPRAAAAFPTKLLDIQAHHRLLAGRDVLGGLAVPRERIRWRVEQSLRNLALRLRRRYIADAGDEAAMARTLASIARPLAIELGYLLTLEGAAQPADDRTATVLSAAAGAFDLNAGALATLDALRQGRDTSSTDLPGVYDATIHAALAAADRAAGGGGTA